MRLVIFYKLYPCDPGNVMQCYLKFLQSARQVKGTVTNPAIGK